MGYFIMKRVGLCLQNLIEFGQKQQYLYNDSDNSLIEKCSETNSKKTYLTYVYQTMIHQKKFQ